ncbi:hypothetical protein ACLB1Q_29275 [Escherichia coli]
MSACDKEYRDPLDRRFHAQPVACPECGPHLEWVSHGEHAEQEAALQAAIAQLENGQHCRHQRDWRISSCLRCT